MRPSERHDTEQTAWPDRLLLSTLDERLPGAVTLGIAWGAGQHIDDALRDLTETARGWGGDAVLGVRVVARQSGALHTGLGTLNATFVAYGTVVRRTTRRDGAETLAAETLAADSQAAETQAPEAPATRPLDR